MAKKKTRKPARKPKPRRTVDVLDLRDQLANICDVIQTVIDALNDENSQPAAGTLLHHALYPLIKIKASLKGSRQLGNEP